jgi:hypothetical protein
LQFSKHEQTGTFFEFGNNIISVYPQTEYYSKKSLASYSTSRYYGVHI